MVQPALLGGLFIGVLSALPFISVGNCCCLWIIGGGFFAAYLDSQNQSRNLTVGRGALDGFCAGVAGACIWLIVAVALDGVTGPMQRRFAEQMASRSDGMPPEVREWFEALATRSTTSSFRWVIGFVVQLFIGSVFAPIGGMLGAVFFKRDIPPALGGDPHSFGGGDVPPLPPLPPR
jgi:hypothetical protein